MAKIGEIRKKKSSAGTRKKTAKPGEPAGKKAGAPAREAPRPPAPPPPSGPGPGPEEGEAREVIVVRVGDNLYGVSLGDVERVEMVEHITPVPGTPGYVLGVASVRGEPVPVVDFRRLFGLAPREWDLSTRILVLRIGGRRVGLLVDEARRVARLGPHEILPPPDLIQGLSGDYLVGIARRGEEALLLLDLEELLALADAGEQGGTHG